MVDSKKSDAGNRNANPGSRRSCAPTSQPANQPTAPNKRTSEQANQRTSQPPLTSEQANQRTSQLIVRDLGRQPYEPVWQAMRDFTDRRDHRTPDELWFVEHAPVFTQGLAGKPEHLLNPGNIPVVQTDRGGQVTYHGPGQLVAYPLLDLKRRGLGVRCLVNRLEQAVIDVLAGFQVRAERLDGAPGVFVGAAKIASIGLKVRRDCTLHGLAFNVDMDLAPFSMINPCGFSGLAMTQLKEYQTTITLPEVAGALTTALCTLLGYHAMKVQYCGLPEPLPIRAA